MKFGKFDEEINHISKVLFLFMFLIAFIMLCAKGIDNGPILFMRYVLLICSIIPISLRVNLDFAKLCFSNWITNDKKIEGTIARNSNLPEELGRIEYLLTDKTGTLTQNDMVFKKLVINNTNYCEENFKEISKSLLKVCNKFNGPMGDVEENEINEKKNVRRKNEYYLRDVFSALAICHNVTPVIDDENQRTL